MSTSADAGSKIIENFSRVQAVMEPLSEIARITLLEEYLVELDQLEYSLSPPLQFRTVSDSLLSTLPTGVREFSGRPILRRHVDQQARFSLHIWVSEPPRTASCLMWYRRTRPCVMHTYCKVHSTPVSI